MKKNTTNTPHRNLFQGVVDSINRHPFIFTLVITALLTVIGALVFHWRYPFAFDNPNFYAEDGRDFIKNLLLKGPIVGSLTAFNGYLIVGQYLVGIFGQLINAIHYGGAFVDLPKSLAIASYIFWGFVCALPWLLFRKRLGMILSLIIVMLLWVTPFGGYDYAIIGTIGNLKFAFLFIATLLIIYRNDTKLCVKPWQFITIDIVLLICVLTNIVTLGILPFLLVRYLKPLIALFKKKKNILKTAFRMEGFLTAILLCVLTFVYLLLVVLHGVPKLPGYLDGPLEKPALIALAYRASTYGILFPVNYLMNNLLVIGSFVLTIIAFIISRNKIVLLTIGVAMILNVVGFVYNRPGVSSFFTTYSDAGWPGQFFYAGTMLFIVGLGFLVKDNFALWKPAAKLFLLLVTVFATVLVLPASGFTHTNRYSGAIEQINTQVSRICASSQATKEVTIKIYPSYEWATTLPREVVCNK